MRVLLDFLKDLFAVLATPVKPEFERPYCRVARRAR